MPNQNKQDRNTAIARNIRQARRERGWAPYDLAEAVRCQGLAATVGDVARWERGERIGTRTERAIRRVLGLEVPS